LIVLVETSAAAAAVVVAALEAAIQAYCNKATKYEILS